MLRMVECRCGSAISLLARPRAMRKVASAIMVLWQVQHGLSRWYAETTNGSKRR